jgi:hypothetical protein
MTVQTQPKHFLIQEPYRGNKVEIYCYKMFIFNPEEGIEGHASAYRLRMLGSY